MLRKLWIELRSSLWFVPTLLVLLAIALAAGLVALDSHFYEALQSHRWGPLLNAGEEGARSMLSAIAGSMITVVGVAFSITIVTLSLASTQYTPRILRNFMRDRANQLVLGVFVAVFTYCLIVLRTIHGSGHDADVGFVPQLAVAFGMLLALLSIGCLIFFIHHVASSIQASAILQAISHETFSSIEDLFPEDLGAGEDDAIVVQTPQRTQWHPISAEANGYLQHLNSAGLTQWAEKHGTVLRLERAPGDFVHDEAPLVSTDRALEKATHGSLRAHFSIGDFRTSEQDVGFGIRQIVDIALKALSPGINDTSTAVSCLDYLGAILTRLACRQITSPFRAEKGGLRVIAVAPTFAEFVAKSLDEIRLSASGNVTILVQILRVLSRVAAGTHAATRRETLLAHAQLASEAADQFVPATYDRARLNAELETTREALRASTASLPSLSTKHTVGAEKGLADTEAKP